MVQLRKYIFIYFFKDKLPFKYLTKAFSKPRTAASLSTTKSGNFPTSLAITASEIGRLTFIDSIKSTNPLSDCLEFGNPVINNVFECKDLRYSSDLKYSILNLL